MRGGGVIEVIEGYWKPKRLIVLRFRSLERANEWANSEEYREARADTAQVNMILVEGV